MTARNLSTVTIDLITSYGNTAKNVINAYRVGNERVIGFMDQRWENALRKTGDQLESDVRGNARFAEKKLTAYYSRGIEFAANSADTVVSKVVELAGEGVQRVAANASQFQNSTGVSTFNTLALAAAPVAEIVSRLVSKIEQGSGALVNRVAGKHAATKVTEATKVAAVKRVTPFKKARARKAA